MPYDKVWRTGANVATTLKTPIHLKIGTIDVPTGTYTIYSLPSKSGSKLIVNKQTGQWGTEYDQSKDLGRTELTSSALTAPVDTFVIEFDKPAGDARNAASEVGKDGPVGPHLSGVNKAGTVAERASGWGHLRIQ